MSLWLAVVRRQAALDTEDHPLQGAYTELQAATAAFRARLELEPKANRRARRAWPERKRFCIAERSYKTLLRTVEGGGWAGGSR